MKRYYSYNHYRYEMLNKSKKEQLKKCILNIQIKK